MDDLLQFQTLQLRLIESASVNESCASDLMGLMHKLVATDANSIISIIGLLKNEAVFLRKVSQNLLILCMTE